MLKDKAKLWGVLTLAYPLVLFAIGAFVAPTLDWKFLGAMLTALLGIPIYAFIAVALGVYGSNPLEQQPNQKVKPAYVYLYMTLSGAVHLRHRHAATRAATHLHGAVDAAGRRAVAEGARSAAAICSIRTPRRRRACSTSDGLIAAMLFFVAQAIAAAVIIGRGRVTGRGGAVRVLHRRRASLMR